jgi:hypothetical protein
MQLWPNFNTLENTDANPDLAALYLQICGCYVTVYNWYLLERDVQILPSPQRRRNIAYIEAVT